MSWFLQLPNTIQRKHFSKEERDLLTGQCEPVILDAADEGFYRLGRRAAETVATVSTFQSSLLSNLSGHPPDSGVEMDDSLFRWMDDDGELDLSLDDYHAHMAESVVITDSSQSSRRPSVRRSISLNSMPFGPPSKMSRLPYFQGYTLPAFDAALAAATRTPSPVRNSRLRSLSRPRKSESTPDRSIQRPTLTSEPSAKHYRDPETRAKLRAYLALPHKFDEVIEFGFPSLQNEERLPKLRPSLPKQHNTAVSAQTFLDDDHESFFETQDEAQEPKPPAYNTIKPPTNAMIENWRRIASAQSMSVDPNAHIPPRVLRHQASEPYVRASIATREQTFHMTLTPPHLRVSDTVKDERGRDPLALEELPQAPERVPWGTAKGEGRVRRMWRKVSGRN